jgi:hypothetical protein
MKKKHRDITVDKVQYGWTVKEVDGINELSIWQDKKVIHTRYFQTTTVITPGLVRMVILSITSKQNIEGEEKMFLVTTTTGNLWEIIGGNYLVKGKDELDVRGKFKVSKNSAKIDSIDEIKPSDFINDTYEINSPVVE